MNDIQCITLCVFFHKVKEGNFITLCDEFQGVFLYVYGV